MENYILNTELPLGQNFKLLKAAGLDYIQQYSGTAWTNLNANDPGITILDQVCFALTELGYCNDFPVEDILTDVAGKLKLEDQFYRPQEILTTAPVTIQDYRRYIIDSIAYIQNATVLPITAGSFVQGVYQVYLMVDEKYLEKEIVENISNAVFFELNKCRNIGELFLKPKVLQVKTHFISGQLHIEEEAQMNTILASINQKIKDHIFPSVKQSGYGKLADEGFETNEIFNGPLLQHGWIPDAALGMHRLSITLMELVNLIETINGVMAIDELTFDGMSGLNTIADHNENLLKIDLALSLKNGLIVYCKGKRLSPNTNFELDPTAAFNALEVPMLGQAVNLHTEQPEGRYRDINSYYSIQHTFPEIFAVGADALTSNASDFQMAQSKQLKGYLTLFDQVLANQFTQLANIGKLFSFKNATSALPSDETDFYSSKDTFQKAHPEFPVPYLSFSPTYFYQSVYDIPHIKPLLKNNELLKLSTALEDEKELEEKSWTAYKEDPYNPYIKGLMTFINEQGDNLDRRNTILDHLLARHGESPLMIDSFINGSVYTGEPLKDQVIFKSLYLQNLGLLGYFKHKAYNFIFSAKISEELPEKQNQNQQKIFSGHTTDFIFNSEQVNHTEKIKEKQFSDYSALELKISLLFGLEVHYHDFIASCFDDDAQLEAFRSSLWITKFRKGLILLENSVLFQNLNYELFLAQDRVVGPFLKTSTTLSFEEIIQVCTAFSHPDYVLNGLIDSKTIQINEQNYDLESFVWSEREALAFKPLAATGYFFSVKIANVDQTIPADTDPFENTVHLIFPSFIQPLNTALFKNRLQKFLQDELPLHIAFHCHFIDAALLAQFIPVFARWYNALHHPHHLGIRQKTEDVMILLNEINAAKND